MCASCGETPSSAADTSSSTEKLSAAYFSSAKPVCPELLSAFIATRISEGPQPRNNNAATPVSLVMRRF